MDTKALVTLCQKGNGQALSLLYENYSEKMLKVCLRYIPDPTIAQDLLHDGLSSYSLPFIRCATRRNWNTG